MNIIHNKTHPLDSFIYSVSRFFERAGHYSVIAFLVLFMYDKIFIKDRTQAIYFYSLLITSFYFTKILGGILGDLFIGNRKTIIFGAILKTLGVFLLLLNSKISLYFGFFLFSLGTGFYIPNIEASIGKIYLKNPKLLDAGFSIQSLVINLAGFFGPFVIVSLFPDSNFQQRFLFSAFLLLFSVIPLFFIKDFKDSSEQKFTLSIDKRILTVILLVVIATLYFTAFDFQHVYIFWLKEKLNNLTNVQLLKDIINTQNSIFILSLYFAFIIFWTIFYYNRYYKLLTGIFFGALSLVFILSIPDNPEKSHIYLFLLSLLFLSLSELHFSPVIMSLLTINTKRNYLAIMFSVYLLPIKLFSFIIGLIFTDIHSTNIIMGIKVGIVSLFIGIILTIFLIEYVNKK